METTQSSLTGILTFLALKVLCPRIAQSSTNQSVGHLFPRVPENLRESGQRRDDGAGLSLSPGKEGWRSSVLGGQGLTWPECGGSYPTTCLCPQGRCSSPHVLSSSPSRKHWSSVTLTMPRWPPRASSTLPGAAAWTNAMLAGWPMAASATPSSPQGLPAVGTNQA